jgi:hypothetical protein
VNILAVKWRNERLVQLGHNFVCDFVAVVLHSFDRLHLFWHASVVRQHLLQRLRAHHNVFSLFHEKVKKSLFARQKPLQKSRHVG